MNLFKLFAQAISIMLITNASIMAQPTTVTLQLDQNGKDCTVNSFNSNSNFVNGPQLSAGVQTTGGTPFEIRGFFQFDFSSIPTNAIIIDAKLSLYAFPYSGANQSRMSGENDCYIKRVTSSWDESTLTWNNMPTVDNSGIKIPLPASFSPYQNYTNTDITPIIKLMLGANNNGFMLQMRDNTPYTYKMLSFGSGDCTDATKRPKLVITYVPAGTPIIAVDSPGTLTVAENTPLQADLSWSDGSNESGYVVERSISNGTNYETIATLPANTHTYSNTGLTLNTLYYYRVRAIGPNGEYNHSNEVHLIAGGIGMENGEATVCAKNFLDPYGNNPLVSSTYTTQTLAPSGTGKVLSVNFTSFALGSDDYLRIYDGPTTTSPIIGTYSGSSSPKVVFSNHSTGKLTFVLSCSDEEPKAAGWVSVVSCVDSITAPSGLSATIENVTSVKLTWNDLSALEDGYIIERAKATTATWTVIDTVKSNVTQLIKTGFETGQKYYFRIRAYNANVKSRYSALAEITMPGPLAPTALLLKSFTPQDVTIGWNENATNETGYIIQRSANDNSHFLDYDTVASNTSMYTDTKMSPQNKYFYRVLAYNSDGRSNYTNEISAYSSVELISSTTLTDCNYVLMDDGGYGNHGNSLTQTMILAPVDPNKKVSIKFKEFLTYTEDKLYIYDPVAKGKDSLVVTMTGNRQDSIVARNSEGKLILKFVSDGSYATKGFVAYVNCLDIPTAPVLTSLDSTARRKITLQWEDNSQNEKNFIVYVSEGDNKNYLPADTLDPNTTSFVYNTTKTGTTFYFKILATGVDGNAPFSNAMRGTIMGPRNLSNFKLKINPLSTNGTITWKDNSNDEIGFIIEYSIGNNLNYVLLAQTEANITSWNLSYLTKNQKYYYRIRVFNEQDSSAYSEGSGWTNALTMTEAIGITTGTDYILYIPEGPEGNFSVGYSQVVERRCGSKQTQLHFYEFNTAEGKDILELHNGNSISSPTIATLSGNQLPADIYSSNTEGQMYISFKITSNEPRPRLAVKVGCATPTSLETLPVKEVKLYPNPASDIVYIQDAVNNYERVVVSDLNGKIMMDQLLTGDNQVNVNQLENGVYMIKLYTKSEVMTAKLLIQRK